MNSSLLIAIIASVFLLAGFAGTILPVLPGVPLAWCGLLLAHFCSYTLTPVWILVITGIAAVAVTVTDSVLQPYLTKKAGGSKNAVRGATIGMIAALFLGPVFIILGPFIGAFAGELLTTRGEPQKALKAAAGSFAGFLVGTGAKMLCVIAFIWIFVFEILN